MSTTKKDLTFPSDPSSNERDPRKDPIPGDVLVKMVGGTRVRKVVLSRPDDNRLFETSGDGVVNVCWISVWQAWAEDAEVERKETVDFFGNELDAVNSYVNSQEEHPVLYRDWETDRKSTRLNSSHSAKSRMPSSA